MDFDPHLALPSPAAETDPPRDRALVGDSALGGDTITRTYAGAALAQAARGVHAAGERIAIHCALPEVIEDAIDAGFDSLGHGSFLQPDQLAAAIDEGAPADLVAYRDNPLDAPTALAQPALIPLDGQIVARP